MGVLKNENSLTVKINKESDIKQTVKKLTFKTFKKWSFKEEETDTDELGYIVSLVCKVRYDV